MRKRYEIFNQNLGSHFPVASCGHVQGKWNGQIA
jgi:hypothetical protein